MSPPRRAEIGKPPLRAAPHFATLRGSLPSGAASQFRDPRTGPQHCILDQSIINQYTSAPTVIHVIEEATDEPLINYKELSSSATGESSASIRQRVMAARRIQATRFTHHPGVTTNSAMSSKLVQTHCRLDHESSALLEQAMEHLNFSARAHDRILKVARTLADLDESHNIRSPHILESIQYRTLDRSLQL